MHDAIVRQVSRMRHASSCFAVHCGVAVRSRPQRVHVRARRVHPAWGANAPTVARCSLNQEPQQVLQNCALHAEGGDDLISGMAWQETEPTPAAIMAGPSLRQKLELLSKLGRLRMTIFSAVTYSTAATLVHAFARLACGCIFGRATEPLPPHQADTPADAHAQTCACTCICTQRWAHWFSEDWARGP